MISVKCGFIPAFVFALLAIGCSGIPEVENAAVVNGLVMRHDYIDAAPYNIRHKMPDGAFEIRTVTIHNTAGYISAQEERDRINAMRDGRSVSFHFAVDECGAVQLIPLSRHAWHAGDGNKGEGNLHSISIEICRSLHRGEKDYLYRHSESNAAILAAFLLDEFGLPDDALKMHKNWSGKNCPHRILEENRWNEFKSSVIKLRKSNKKSANSE